MSYQLIGYLVSGPKELTNLDTKRRRFERHLEKMKNTIRAMEEDPDMSAPEWFPPEFDTDYCFHKEDVMEADAAEVWDQTIRLWSGDHLPEDCARRQDRNNTHMFCGEMTGGDEPEGEGFRILRLASLTGLLDILRIS